MTYSPATLASVINQNKEKKLAVSKIMETNPSAISVIPKLIQDKTNNTNTREDNLQLNRSMLESISTQLENNRNNNRNIMKLFPDIELCVQILVSSILSPKKMTDVQLIYKLKKDFKFPPTVAAAMITVIQKYMTEEWKLEDKLPDIVREALFTAGSYSMGIFPESAIDEVINKDIIATFSTEAYREEVDSLITEVTTPLHLKKYDFNDQLTVEGKVSAESFVKHIASSNFISITDNSNLLKFAELKQDISSNLIKKSFRKRDKIAVEGVKDKIEYLDIFRQRGSTRTQSNVTVMKTRDEARRRSIGKPMVVKFPASSVIPVTIPGNPQEHAGYLILQDGEGKPLNMDASNDAEHNLKGNLFSDSNSGGSTPVQIAFKNLIADTDAKIDSNQLFNMYKEIIERQIFSTIKGTLYGKSVDIANKNDIYYFMFMRAIADEKTSILFVPKEQMVYFHFNLNDYGIGKSVLDNLSILTSLRAILLFARVMAQSKSAIDVTNVDITFDPRDPDPEKTIAMIQDSTLKLRQNFFPLGINNPVDLVNWIQRAGLKFSYSGHPQLPDTKVQFENANISHTVPTGELEEALRKQTFQALGIPPEVIDNAFSPEFATNVVNNNILLSKRVLLNQQSLTRDLTKLHNLHIYNDESLRELLRDVVEKNFEEISIVLDENLKSLYNKDKTAFMDTFLDRIAENIEIELPKPENTNLTNLAAEFEEYKKGVTSVFEFMMNTETFAEDIAGQMSTHIETLKNIYITQLLREWCANNNYFPEAVALISASQDDMKKTIETISQQLTSTLRNGALILRTMQGIKKAINLDIANVSGEGGDGSGTPTSDTSSSSDSNDGGSGGGNDLNFGGGGGDDLGSNESDPFKFD